MNSADSDFNALTDADVADVAISNQDNDAPGIVLSLLYNNFFASENGMSVIVQFELLSFPLGGEDVVVPLSLSGDVEPSVPSAVGSPPPSRLQDTTWQRVDPAGHAALSRFCLHYCQYPGPGLCAQPRRFFGMCEHVSLQVLQPHEHTCSYSLLIHIWSSSLNMLMCRYFNLMGIHVCVPC